MNNITAPNSTLASPAAHGSRVHPKGQLASLPHFREFGELAVCELPAERAAPKPSPRLTASLDATLLGDELRKVLPAEELGPT